jgi:hypothetical protein
MDDNEILKWHGPDRQTWYIVAHAGDLAVAEIPAGLLRGANIPVVLLREAAGSSAIPLTVGLLGGVDIAVPEAYYEEAKALLDLDLDESLGELPDELPDEPQGEPQDELQEESQGEPPDKPQGEEQPGGKIDQT